MRISDVSLGLENVHIGDGNGSGQKLNVIGIGIEAVREGDHSDPSLGKLSVVSSCHTERKPEHVRY
jgi:hypothetical protein